MCVRERDRERESVCERERDLEEVGELGVAEGDEAGFPPRVPV